MHSHGTRALSGLLRRVLIESDVQRHATPHGEIADGQSDAGPVPEVHLGFGFEQTGMNKDWLSTLAKSLETEYWKNPNSGGPEGAKNTNIPAGYTYFGQLIAHDFSNHVSPSNAPQDEEAQNILAEDHLAAKGLTLHTIYGDGPLENPAPYQPRECGNVKSQRVLLKLGRVRVRGGGNKFELSSNNPQRDIPRLGCPYKPRRDTGFADTLISDPRNDDNLVLSQLTMMFHTLHNRVYSEISGLDLSAGHLQKYTDEHMRFAAARTIVAYVYRSLIVRDYLPRLLHPKIQRLFDADSFECAEGAIDFRTTGNDVTREFSLAAFRMGHAMIRSVYQINEALRNDNDDIMTPSIAELLDRTSARQCEHVPLEETWTIQWHRFFDLGDGRQPQSSIKLGPSFRSGLINYNGISLPGNDELGLHEIDLFRGLDGQMRSVRTLISLLPETLRRESPLLSADERVSDAVDEWLKTKVPAIRDKLDSNGQLEKTRTDPPPLIFILLEAAITGGRKKRGTRMGILGSALVADTVYRVLRRGRGEIEEDEDLTNLAHTILPAVAFEEMGRLIRWVWPDTD